MAKSGWWYWKINTGDRTSGPPAAGSLFVSIYSNPALAPCSACPPDQQHWGYIDGTGAVQDAWFQGAVNDGAFHLQQINTTKNKKGNTSGPPAAGSLFISVYNGQHHWGYIDGTGAVEDAWFDGHAGDPWKLQQINTTPKQKGNSQDAPPAAGSLFVSVYNGQHHWGYIDRDGGVQDVWFDGHTGDPWNLQLINTTKNKKGNTSGPPAAAGSLFVSVYSGQHHWGYIDGTGAVQDAWFNGQAGSPWQLQQLNMK